MKTYRKLFLIPAAVFCFSILFGSCSFQNNDKLVGKRLAEKPYEGVYYSIFVRSFADSDGDGIGDFNGLTAKLDYLNDGNDETDSDLGITGIWLLPVFASMSYHGYDVDDYYSVNPDYGTMEDFENLLKECSKRGISVIIDMTMNHSSVYNEWFKASRNPQDEHHSWYRWITADTPDYSLKMKIWDHNVWNEDAKYKGNYYAGLFGDHMPDFNLDSPELREEFKKVVKFWMDKGVAGFRFDAAGHIYNSAKTPIGSNSVESAVGWWKEIVDYEKTVNPDTYNVGEVWENSAIRASYIAGLGSDFHFDMGTKIIDVIKSGNNGNNGYANTLAVEYERLAQENPDYIDAPFLSNHDQPRAAGLLKGNVPMLKASASMYMLMEGVPFIYYGEEIGMMSGTDDPSKRTPMLWDVTEDSGKPKDKLQTWWIDSIHNKKTLSVAQQSKDKDSLLNYYKKLIKVRTGLKAFCGGRFTSVYCNNPAVSSWQIADDKGNAAFIMVNVTGEAVEFTLPDAYKEFNAKFYSDSKVSLKKDKDSCSVKLSPYGTLVVSNE